MASTVVESTLPSSATAASSAQCDAPAKVAVVSAVTWGEAVRTVLQHLLGSKSQLDHVEVRFPAQYSVTSPSMRPVRVRRAAKSGGEDQASLVFQRARAPSQDWLASSSASSSYGGRDVLFSDRHVDRDDMARYCERASEQHASRVCFTVSKTAPDVSTLLLKPYSYTVEEEDDGWVLVLERRIAHRADACVVCLDAHPNCDPGCGHQCLCVACYDEVEQSTDEGVKCPICRFA